MAGKYSAQQFINAIPGTGGIISAIAGRVGCDWHTAKKYIEQHTTVKLAWEAERNKVTDRARHNIIKAIEGGDLQMSKWWMQVMDEDFAPRQKLEIYDWRKEAQAAGINPADVFEQYVQQAVEAMKDG